MIATLAGERELASVILQAIAAIAVGAMLRDAWHWQRRGRSVRQHPAGHRRATGTGQRSRDDRKDSDEAQR